MLYFRLSKNGLDFEELSWASPLLCIVHGVAKRFMVDKWRWIVVLNHVERLNMKKPLLTLLFKGTGGVMLSCCDL